MTLFICLVSRTKHHCAETLILGYCVIRLSSKYFVFFLFYCVFFMDLFTIFVAICHITKQLFGKICHNHFVCVLITVCLVNYVFSCTVLYR